MSWNHTQEYETAGYQDYASRLGGGQYEKVWDLGKLLCLLSTPQSAALILSLLDGKPSDPHRSSICLEPHKHFFSPLPDSLLYIESLSAHIP